MKNIAMKSSPRDETPPSTGSKTPASGKKLVQARLPFKTLGGSEPPFTVANEAAGTPSSAADNRKRKPNDGANEDGIRAAKQNRCEYKRGDNISLETTEIMELSNDIPTSSETENGTKRTKTKSESKENVCVAKNSADEIVLSDDDDDGGGGVEKDPGSAPHEPKAKQSLDFEKKHSELRKSKRTNESNLITIKLPMSKKSKEAKAKKVKKQKDTSNDDVHKDKEKDDAKDETATTEDEEDEEKERENDRNVDLNVSTLIPEEEIVDRGEPSTNEKSSGLNDSIVSNPPEQCATDHKLTPKQMQRRLESEKKKQEKEQAKLERERKLQEEKEMRQREKDLQKKREREEKDEQRKKEKEMREKKLQEEKMEKQREKELKEQQRKLEREEKEEQRRREKEERELQKKREREEKEREKEEERKKKEEEKRQKMEAEQNKNRKTAEAFVKFFVPKKVDGKSETSENGDNMDCDQVPQTFMSFQVKEDMKMAPIIRRALNSDERSSFEQHLMSSGIAKDNLYLSQLKRNIFTPRKMFRTWADDEDEKSSNDDLFIIEENGQNVQLLKEEPKKLYRAKFFKFSENRRPPYYGTWRKKSKTINPRKPLAMDSQLDYDVDSDDEWEEEEPGESVESDDEKEVESEDEYEIDNEFFVPHGHLSDEELQNEDEPEFNNPADLKIKLKMAQNEFEDERKKKTQKIKPRLIGFIWQNMDGTKPDNCSNGVWELMNQSAMLFNGSTVKIEHPISQSADNSDDETSTTNKPADKRRLPIGEKEIPDLIRLINGNTRNSKLLVKEFCAFLAKNNQPQREYSGASIKAKIQELAKYGACPEEGPMFKKQCWYVPIDTRKRYNLNDLSLPNTWSYTMPIPSQRPAEPIVNNENKESEKATDPNECIQLSDDSNSCNFASETLTPELLKQAKSKKTNYNIAKFIRKLTVDEKKKQFEPITFNRRASEDQSNDAPSTSQASDSKGKKGRATKRAASSTPDSTVPKKRINLLMSGPIGQEFSPRMKTTLVTQFLNANSKNQKSADLADNQVSGTSLSNTAGTSDGAKNTSLSDPVIVID